MVQSCVKYIIEDKSMKVVIDIPEALYDRVKQLDYSINMYDFADSMYQADIKNLAIAIKDGSLKEIENEND